MYGRTLGDRVLEFGHQGILYRNSFVMYDKQTESLWLHVTGEALQGPLKGSKLEFLPSVVVPWGLWKLRHPGSRVLLGRKARGMMGAFALGRARELYGLSVGQGRRVRLYTWKLLSRRRWLQDEGLEEGRPLLVAADPETGLGRAWVRVLDGRTLVFEEAAPEDGALRLRDRDSGSLWDPFQGRCVSGKRRGAELPWVPATFWLLERWKGFFGEAGIRDLPAPEKKEGTGTAAPAPAGEGGGR